MGGLVDAQGPFQQRAGGGRLGPGLQVDPGAVQQPGGRSGCRWAGIGEAGDQHVGECLLPAGPGLWLADDVCGKCGPQQFKCGQLPGFPLVGGEGAADGGLHQPVHLDAVACPAGKCVTMQRPEGALLVDRLGQGLPQGLRQPCRTLLAEDPHWEWFWGQERRLLQ